MAEMKPPAAGENPSERRRSHRVNIAMPVLLRGTKGTQRFEEAVQTISVNAHGCMMRVANPLARSEEISIVNTKTAEEMPCTVTFIGQRKVEKLKLALSLRNLHLFSGALLSRPKTGIPQSASVPVAQRPRQPRPFADNLPRRKLYRRILTVSGSILIFPAPLISRFCHKSAVPVDNSFDLFEDPALKSGFEERIDSAKKDEIDAGPDILLVAPLFPTLPPFFRPDWLKPLGVLARVLIPCFWHRRSSRRTSESDSVQCVARRI